jgi:hypothetical protein
MVPVGIGAVMNCAKALGMVVQKAGTIGIVAGRRFTVPDRATTRVPLQWEALTPTLSDHLATPSFAELRGPTPSLDVPAAAIPLRQKISQVVVMDFLQATDQLLPILAVNRGPGVDGAELNRKVGGFSDLGHLICCVD